MKILSVVSIREADNYTIANEPIKSADLMERAANRCMHWFNDNYNILTELTFVCGLGNNGGDGLAIARMWHEIGSKSKVIIINHSNKLSADFEINFNRLKEYDIPVFTVNSLNDFPELNENEIIVDAVLGSGLNNPLSGLLSDIISHLNKLKNEKVSIDIPSGLFADKSNNADDVIFEANTTLSFEVPKLAFFFPQNYKYVGNWKVLPIQLSSEFIAKVKTKNFYISDEIIKKLYKTRNKFAHKGNYGHSLIVAGSYGKSGAAVLAAKACLKAGAGLLTVHCPSLSINIIQTAIPEAMVECDIDDKHISFVHNVDKCDVIGMGPGIGIDIKTCQALHEVLLNNKKPMVLDADAINILSENKSWIQHIPQHSILTPHLKEFERLTHKVENNFDRNKLQRDFSVKHKLYIILKGANTCISTPEGDCYFNITGNPGMATAGSGDVLTGFLTGLLSQGYTSFETSLLGVYLHGLAGDLYKENYAEESLIASDLIKYFGKALKTI